MQWNGSFKVYRVAARGVRLKGRMVSAKVNWGQVDKLLPPPSGKPFSLPDLTVDRRHDRRASHALGGMGFAVAGGGNLAGGFKGRLAVSAPG